MQTTTNGHDAECNHRDRIEVAVIEDALGLGATEEKVRVTIDPAVGLVSILQDLDPEGDPDLADVVVVSDDAALALAAVLIQAVRQSSNVWREHYAEHEAGQE